MKDTRPQERPSGFFKNNNNINLLSFFLSFFPSFFLFLSLYQIFLIVNMCFNLSSFYCIFFVSFLFGKKKKIFCCKIIFDACVVLSITSRNGNPIKEILSSKRQIYFSISWCCITSIPFVTIWQKGLNGRISLVNKFWCCLLEKG